MSPIVARSVASWYECKTNLINWHIFEVCAVQVFGWLAITKTTGIILVCFDVKCTWAYKKILKIWKVCLGIYYVASNLKQPRGRGLGSLGLRHLVAQSWTQQPCGGAHGRHKRLRLAINAPSPLHRPCAKARWWPLISKDHLYTVTWRASISEQRSDSYLLATAKVAACCSKRQKQIISKRHLIIANDVTPSTLAVAQAMIITIRVKSWYHSSSAWSK